MEAITYSKARSNLKEIMDKAVHDKSEIVITRQNEEHVVMVGLAEWNSIQETLYLLSSPENAHRLRDSIAQLDAERGQERVLVE